MKYIKTFENLYNVGDYVEIKSPEYIDNVDTVIVKIDISIAHQVSKSENSYRGDIVVPYDARNWTEYFSDKDVIRKLSKDEIDLIINSNKYNL